MDNVYIESGDIDISDGEMIQYINRVIPDINFTGDGDAQTINLVLKTRNFPGDSLNTSSTSNVTSTTQQLNVRGRARQAVLRFESDDDNTSGGAAGVGFRIGATRVGIRPDGKR